MLKPEDVMIIIPTLGRHLLQQTLLSFLKTSPPEVKTVVVFDGVSPLTLVELESSQIMVVENKERRGFWGSLNAGMDSLPRPLIGFYADDVIFYPDWLEAALNCYKGGLMAVQDGVWDNYHASHGFISRKWLWVLYGKSKFPEEYKHGFGDSELTQFSRDLGGFQYCAACHIEHIHHDNKKREWDVIDEIGASTRYEDGTLHPIRYDEWARAGKREAKRRKANQHG